MISKSADVRAEGAPTPTGWRAPSFFPIAAIVALLCVVVGAVLRNNTGSAEGVGYFCLTLTLLACAFTFQSSARFSVRVLRPRWMLMAAAAALGAAGYFISFLESSLPEYFSLRVVQVSCFTFSEAMYLLAVILFFSGVVRSVVLVDTLQAFLFVVLRFNLTYSPDTHDHFALGHLLTGQLVALTLFLVALIGCAGASSLAELRFLRVISWFFGLRLIGFFLSNQVSFTWLGYQHCSLWDIAGIVLFSAFALHCRAGLCEAQSGTEDLSQARQPSTAVRNLMPSFLALVNVALALITLRESRTVASISLALAVVFYVTRTTLFQGQAAANQALLQSRNEHLEGLSTHDPLTGIGNRRSLAEAYRQHRAASATDLVLLLIDIDHFKQANDRYGHIHGDHVLIALGRKLEGFAQQVPGGHCARFGGDEFALLLPGISFHRASSLAEELRSSFASHRFQGVEETGTLSVGLAVLDKNTESLEGLITSADDALYRAKLQGRNRVAAA